MKAQRGQGTIEYLVIIAIVIVIALVVVGLLLQIMGNSGGISENAARVQWKTASPFAISDWSRSGNTLYASVKNNTSETLGLVNFCPSRATGSGADCNTTGYTLGAQQSVTVTATPATSFNCTSGSKYVLPKATIHIDYNSSLATGLVESAVADLVGTC